jgi:phosphoribosyl-AMP cyclohydrolase / phosphoribosyl-ATP pyrophosphohydrolase
MKIDYSKYSDGLVPAIVQDANTQKVLMLGFMNAEAVAQTQATGKVTFFSRSKNRLWTKGEESGNFLVFQSMSVDCDNDTLLMQANPIGPTCHTGADTCWNEKNVSENFLWQLEKTIAQRRNDAPENSYTAKMFAKGLNKIAQKVGEEAVELVIESKDDNKDLFLNEAADLMFHYLMLLQAKGFQLNDVLEVLKSRVKV